MQNVFIYGDSITWGIIPDTRKRFSFEERWPGVLENQLRDSGKDARMIEDCLNARRTVWEDPFKPGRNGRQGLAHSAGAQRRAAQTPARRLRHRPDP